MKTVPVVDCEGLVHIYRAAELEVVALQGLDLTVEPAEVVGIVGRSGSGKSTLMNILGGLEAPTAGRARVAGHDLVRMSEPEREGFRERVVGYVLQHAQANLAPELPLADNVELPMLAGVARSQRRERARWLLDRMGLLQLADRRPAEISGGEAQRLALAVALANQPQLLLADEPTAELDRSTAGRILADLADLLHETGTAAVIVTHDPDVERHADRVVRIRDGRTSTERRPAAAEEGAELVIMDRAGRLQVPRALVETLGLGRLVQMRVEGGRLVIEPAASDRP